MKTCLLKSITFVLMLALVTSTGCGLFSTEESGSEEKAGTEKQAIDTLAQFGIVNELATLRVLEIFSEDFTQPLFGEQVKISNEDYDTLYSLMAELGAYEEAVMAALSVLIPQEFVYRHEVVVAGLLPLNPEISPQAASPGVFSSFIDFFGFLGNTGKRSRERIVNLSQNASDAQKRQMYNDLRPEWKEKAKDHNEFFKKLKNGELDSQASQMHNDFVHNPDLGFYQDGAQDKGARPDQIVYKEGGEMVKKGTQFYGEVVTTVIDKALPGFADGVQKAKDLNEKIEKFEKFTKTYYKDGFGKAVNEAIEGHYQKKVEDATKGVLGGEVGDAVIYFAKKITEKEKSPDKGKVVVKNPGQKNNYQNVIAFNKDDDALLKMLAYIGDSGKPVNITLPEGEYLVVATDETGEDPGKNEDVTVTGGEETTVTMEPIAPTTDKVTDIMDDARGKLQDVLTGIEEGKKKLEEITEEKQEKITKEKQEEKPAEETSTGKSTSQDKTGYPQDGKWEIKATLEVDTFKTDDGTTFSCEPFEIQFQIRNGQIQKMHSPRYAYISEDYAGGCGKVTLDRAGALEIVINKGNQDKIEGRLSNTGGSGKWLSILTWEGKEYEGCRGTWEAERKGNLSE